MSDNNVEVKFGAETSGLNAGAQQAASAVEKALKRMESAFGKMATDAKAGSDAVKTGMGNIERESKRTADLLEAFGGTLRNLFAVGSIVAIGKEFVQLSDQIQLNDARLRLVSKSSEEFAGAQKAIYEIAQANNVGIAETTQLYTKLAIPVQRMGGSYKEVQSITDAFATSMRVGGASTQEAAAATLQFAQAMGSGKLQGDEFRSMAEASPRFMRALADGMGVPIEQLKKMGTDGKLTADVVGNALIRELANLKKEAASLPDTVGGSFTRLKNDVYNLARTFNEANGVTATLADVISVVADYVKELDKVLKDTTTSATGAADAADLLSIAMSGIGNVFETVLVLGANVKFVLVQVGLAIGALAAAAAAVANGDFKLVPVIFRELAADGEKARKELDAFEARVMKMGKNVAEARRLLKEQQANATGESGDKPTTLKPPAGATASGDKESRLAQWRDELTQKLQSQKLYFKDTAQLERDYWDGVAAHNKLSVDEKRQINGIIFGLDKQLANEQRALDQQAIDTKKAEAMQDLENKRAVLSLQESMGKINKQQELEQLRAFKQQEYEIEMQAFQQKLELIKEEGLARQKLLSDMAAAKQKHEATMMQQETQIFNEIKAKWQTALSPISQAFGTAVQGIIMGTTTVKQAMANMVQSILLSFINMGIQMLTNWIATQIAIMVFGKTAAAKEGMAQAGAGAAAAMASVAAIPYIGWALAPEVGAQHFAMASGFVAAGTAAEKGFDVPQGVNPVTQLHQKEMVLPASLADNVRNMTDGGGGQPMTVNISAVDGDSVRKLFMREGAAIADAMKQQVRNFRVAKA